MNSKAARFEAKSGINPWRRRDSGIPDLWQLFFDVVVAAVVVMEASRISQAGADFGSFALLAGGLTAAVVRRRLPSLALAATVLLTVLLPAQTGQHLPAW